MNAFDASPEDLYEAGFTRRWPASRAGCEWCAGIKTATPDEWIDDHCDLCKRPLDPESLRAVARGEMWQGPIKPEPNQYAITLNLISLDARQNFWEGDE